VELTVAIGALLAGTIALACWLAFRVGVWKTRTAVFKLKEAQQHEAMDVLAGPAPTDGDLLERL
jgi:hypothetical protein